MFLCDRLCVTSMVKKFLQLPLHLKLLLLEAILLVFSAKFLLVILPLKTVMKFSGQKTSATKNTNPDRQELSEIKKVLTYTQMISFWRNKCLVQSIAGRWMLQRRGIVSRISFGVKLDKDHKLIAHAWLNADNFEIIEQGGDYQELINI